MATALRISLRLSMLFFLGVTQSVEETEGAALILLQPKGAKLHTTVTQNKETETKQHLDAALLAVETAQNQAAFETYLRVEQGHWSEAERDLSPLMTSEEIQFLRQELSKADAYLEFGVGGSSAVASTYPNLQCYKGIDSSKDWIDMVSKQDTIAKFIASIGLSELKYVDIGETGRLGYPVDNTTFQKWPNYSNEGYEGFEKCPQAKHRLVLVDGRFRVACIAKLLLTMDQEAASKTHLLIHNYRWQAYHVIEDFADLIETLRHKFRTQLHNRFAQHVALLCSILLGLDCDPSLWPFFFHCFSKDARRTCPFQEEVPCRSHSVADGGKELWAYTALRVVLPTRFWNPTIRGSRNSTRACI